MLLSDAQRIYSDAIKIAIASRRQPGQRCGRLPHHLRSSIIALANDGFAVEDIAGETGASSRTIAVWLDSNTRERPDLSQTPPRIFTFEPALSLPSRRTVRLLVGTLEISISAVEPV